MSDTPFRTARPDLTWLSPEQAAASAGFSTKTIYRAMWSGELVAHKRRRRWRIRPEALAQWIESERSDDAPVTVSSRVRARRLPRSEPHGSLGRLLAEQEGEVA